MNRYFKSLGIISSLNLAFLLSEAILSSPSFGLTLTEVSLPEDASIVDSWTPLDWQVYWRGGGKSTWEATVRERYGEDLVPLSFPQDPQINLRWPSEQALPWSARIVDIDGENRQLEFTSADWISTAPDSVQIGGEQTIVSQPFSKELSPRAFTIFSGSTFIEGRASQGTEVDVGITRINDHLVEGINCPAISVIENLEDNCKSAFISDEEILYIEGWAAMRWRDGLNPFQTNPQSNLQIFFEIYDPNVIRGQDDEPSTTTPETSNLLVLLGLGGLGIWKLRFRN